MEAPKHAQDGKQIKITDTFDYFIFPLIKSRSNTYFLKFLIRFFFFVLQCSKTCGSGISTRSVTCVNERGRIAPDTACDKSVKPTERLSCDKERCAKWSVGPWTKVSGLQLCFQLIFFKCLVFTVKFAVVLFLSTKRYIESYRVYSGIQRR